MTDGIAESMSYQDGNFMPSHNSNHLLIRRPHSVPLEVLFNSVPLEVLLKSVFLKLKVEHVHVC